VRQQVPAARAVPVVVEPRAEDEVRCDGEEDPGTVLAELLHSQKGEEVK
jgi:hypothetical protein